MTLIPDRKSFYFDNKQVYYNATGNGKVVMLIHGYGANAQIWENIIPLLSPGYKYIFPELPGSGFSDVVNPLRIKYLAEVMRAIIAEEQNNNCIVLGHSMGGYVALQFADMYPDMLAGIGLIHSHVFPDDEAKKAARYKSATFIERNGSEIYLDEFVPNLFAPSTAKSIIDDHRKSIRNTPAEGLIADIKAMAERENKEDTLKHIKQPVLFVLGAHDALMPVDFLLKQTSIPRLAQIELMHISGHMSMVEEPATFANAVNRFLQLCHTMTA